MPGMRISESTMSGLASSISSSPRLPPCATTGLNPSVLSRIVNDSRMPDSSSMMRTVGLCSMDGSGVDRRRDGVAGEHDGHASARRAAVDEDEPLVRDNGAMDDREPEAGALRFGGRERVEKPAAHFFGNARP